MGWILASGVVQLLSRLFAGKGSFEYTASVFGFGIAIPIWAALLHDLVESFLGAVRVINQREYEIALNSPTPWRALLLVLYAIYAVWYFVVFAKAVGAAQKVRRGPAIFLGALGFIIYQLVFFIFNR
jgi:hypothetical protein